MRVVVVGMGVQGRKREAVAGPDVIATVDPVLAASHTDILDVPADSYDAALVCTPDAAKPELLEHLLGAGKHVLVEKPLLTDDGVVEHLAGLARSSGAVCYTAYNHRFEPHIRRLHDVVADGRLGEIYRVRLFYGNGTARDVRSSPWRDRGLGVLGDLGSHLLDILLFVVGAVPDDLEVWAAHRFENAAFDHVVCGSRSVPLVELEMSLLSWRNQFGAEVVGSAGSASIDSLCKWGPSTFTLRTRVLPSGRPPEESVVLVQPDPTWEAEYRHFEALCGQGGPSTLEKDAVISRALHALGRRAQAGVT